MTLTRPNSPPSGSTSVIGDDVHVVTAEDSGVGGETDKKCPLPLLFPRHCYPRRVQAVRPTGLRSIDVAEASMLYTQSLMSSIIVTKSSMKGFDELT